MRSRSGRRTATFRSLATVLAATGAVLVSSAFALMTTSTTATADSEHGAHKSYVCKYVGKPGEGTEVLQSGTNPIWVDNHTLTGKDEPVTEGAVFADAQGYSVVVRANTEKLDPEPVCPTSKPVATPVVSFTDASCTVPAHGTYVATGEHVTFEVTGTTTVGDTMTIEATAADGYTLATGVENPRTHTFLPATGCPTPNVSPPVVEPPTVSTPKHHATVSGTTTTPTVVEAGLAAASPSTPSGRGEALALLAAGLLMTAASGGLVVTVRRRSGRAS